MPSIDKLPPLPKIISEQSPYAQTPATEKGASFGDTLKQFLTDVNQMQQTAGDKTLKFATGEIKDLHEVMAATEEAGISLMLLLEIRNKALEAYKELMRIQV